MSRATAFVRQSLSAVALSAFVLCALVLYASAGPARAAEPAASPAPSRFRWSPTRRRSIPRRTGPAGARRSRSRCRGTCSTSSPASEPTTAHLATDGANLYVRFEAQQREPLLAQQHTNDVGDGTDDEVWIDLWPGGNAGFYYQFAATSNGTHFQYSSENTAYAPTWESYGSPREGGFTITMRIPLRALRGSGGAGLEGPARAHRALDRRAADLELRAGPDERRRRDLRRHAERSGGQRGPAQPARRALRAGRDGLARVGSDHLAHGRRLLAARDRDVVGLRHDPPRLLERRDRPADDLADRLPALVQRGPAVLHPGRELLRQLRLRRVPVRRRSSTRRRSPPRATATRSRASRASSRSPASTRSATAATTARPR